MPPAFATTLVAPRGWDDLADADGFYPADLPADWRLTWFANAFGAVLLPWSAWGAAPVPLADWREEVGPRFRFFLGRPASAAAAPIAGARLALDGALGGWLVTADGEVGAASGPLLAPDDGAHGLAVLAPTHVLGAPRAARDWLEGLPERPGLVILPRPSSGDLTAWGHLLALLGWA